MSKTPQTQSGSSPRGGRRGHARHRRISVRAVRRETPDIAKLGRAVITLALAEAERAAAADAAARGTAVTTPVVDDGDLAPDAGDDDRDHGAADV